MNLQKMMQQAQQMQKKLTDMQGAAHRAHLTETLPLLDRHAAQTARLRPRTLPSWGRR